MQRLLAVVAVALLATACSSDHRPEPTGLGLGVLRQLTADQSSFGVVLDASSGRALAAFRVNNPIRAAVPDGKGGWYIGGGFIYVNGVLRKRLAHIDRDGRLDPHWKPEANGNGVSVTSLARIGTRLYVAGDFARLQHEPRFQLGALDLRNGRLERWRPARSAWYSYNALFAARRRLITAGTSCCSKAGSTAFALDARSGAVDRSWKPRVGPAKLYGDGVYMLASGGRALLIRGGLGRADYGVAVGEIDPATGRLVRKWTPRVSRYDCLWCELATAALGKRRVFAMANGFPLVLAFGTQTAAVDHRWRAPISTVTDFYGASPAALAVAAGRVYVAGDFDRIRGVPRRGLAALDEETGRVLPSWQPQAASVAGTLLAASGDRLLLGITLARQLQFSYTGLKTFRAVRTLRLVLGLNGRGRVRILLGRGCNVERWASSSSLRCEGRVVRWLAAVWFERRARKRFVRRLDVPAGRYFVRFVPENPAGVPQAPPQDFPIVVP